MRAVTLARAGSAAAICFSLAALAQNADRNHLGPLIENAQDGVRKMAPGKPACPGCEASASLEACGKLVCTPANSTTPYQDQLKKAEDKAAALEADLKASLGPHVKKAYEAQLADELGTLHAIESFMKSGKTRFTDAFIPIQLIALAVAMDDFGVVYSDKSTDDHTIVDRVKSRRPAANLTPAARKFLFDATEELLNDPDFKGMYDDTPVRAQLRKKYPELTLVEALKKEASEASALLAEAQKKVLTPAGVPESLLNSMFSLKVYAPILEGKRTDAKSLSDFYTSLQAAKVFAGLLLHPEKIKALGSFHPQDLKDIYQGPNVLANVRKSIAYLEKRQALGDKSPLLTKAIDDCAQNLALAKSALPPASDDADKAVAMVEDVKKAFTARILPKFSAHSAQVLSKALKDIEVYPPQTSPEFEGFLGTTLDSSLESSNADVRFYHDAAGTPAASQFAVGNLTSYAKADYQAEEHFKDPFSFCKDVTLPVADDKAFLLSGAFQLSWNSVANLDYGKTSAAHEIGHLMKAALETHEISKESSERFQKMEACLADKHPEAKKDFYKVEVPFPYERPIEPGQKETVYDLTESPYNEEDTADMFSALAIPELNDGCTLWNQNSEKLVDKVADVEKTATTRHSSVLFRILHSETVRKGVLPDLCTKALKAHGVEHDFSSCL